MATALKDELFNHALKHHQSKNYTVAIQYYKKVLKQNPERADALQNLAAALSASGSYPAAKLLFEKAIKLNNDSASLWSSYGNLLCNMGLHEQSHRAHQKAIQLDGDAGNYYNAGNLPFCTNQPDEAIKYYDKAIAHSPNYAKARWNKALANLQKGNWQEGFSDYEQRLHLYQQIIRVLPGKKWSGENLDGKRIIITTEQGFGDVIQFVRLLYLLAKKYRATIYLECQQPLVRLLAPISCISGIIERGKTLPDYDYYFPLLSLPAQLKPEPSSYLSKENYIPVEMGEKWSLLEQVLIIRRFTGLKVGLIWKSKATPYDRSCQLEEFAPLFELNGNIQFYSLQYGNDSQEINQNHFEPFINDVSSCINDFYDTAVLMKEMDLIISVDSAPAHLAGALGIPTWVMLLKYADWRWLLNRNDSPWYSKARLYRQAEMGSWEKVIEEIKADLLKLQTRQAT